MKAISLWQPWASALFTHLKPDETRHWRLPGCLIGATMAIHAAKRDTRDERDFWTYIVDESPNCLEAFQTIGITAYADLPRGAIIGTLKFIACHRTEDRAPNEWGNYEPGRFAWEVQDAVLLPSPIPCVGRQRIFEWPGTTQQPIPIAPIAGLLL